MFLKVFGSTGLPRDPQEAQEGSQEAPKGLQNPKKRDPKMDPKNKDPAENALGGRSRFFTFLEPILGSKIGTFLVIFGVIFWTTFW